MPDAKFIYNVAVINTNNIFCSIDVCMNIDIWGKSGVHDHLGSYDCEMFTFGTMKFNKYYYFSVLIYICIDQNCIFVIPIFHSHIVPRVRLQIVSARVWRRFWRSFFLRFLFHI